MSFAAELAAASGTLTAAQIAAATGASKRTVEDWRLGRSAPLPRYRADILSRVKRAAKASQSPKAPALRSELESRARELCAAIASMLDGTGSVSFRGYENGHGEEVGTRVQAARRALESILPNAEVRHGGPKGRSCLRRIVRSRPLSLNTP